MVNINKAINNIVNVIKEKYCNYLKHKQCSHYWLIVKKSNVIELDDFGYPLMYCKVKCKHCNKTKNMWVDVTTDVLKRKDLTIVKWE